MKKVKTSQMKPYKIISSKFLGQEHGMFTYELTFNQSIVHIGRWRGIEDGLNAYRERELKEEEQEILDRANDAHSYESDHRWEEQKADQDADDLQRWEDRK